MLSLVIVLPLITSLLLFIKKRSRNLFYIAKVLLALTSLYILNFKILDSTEGYVHWGFDMVFFFDKYSWFFANLVNIAWLITIIYSYSYVKYRFAEKAKSFHFLLSTVISTVLAVIFAANLTTVFVFYFLSIPCIYYLMRLRLIEENKLASKFYLFNVVVPALFILLPAIIYFNYRAPGFRFGDQVPEFLSQEPLVASIILIAIIMGMSRNSIIPFDRWLDKTVEAPAPVCALVNSVAAVKLGVISLIKIAVYVYGLDLLRELNSNFFHVGFMTYLCGITAVLASIKAYKSTNLKLRFTYSTVTQLSFIITAILVSTPTSILGAMLHVLTHSFAKICLFFVAGYYNCAYNTVSIPDLLKIIPSRKILSLVITVCGFSIAGFPFLAGYLSKDLMLIEEFNSGNYAAVFFLVVGSVINIFYILPLFKNSIFKKADPSIEIKQVPLPMKIAISMCMCVIIYLSIYTYTIVRFVMQS